MTTRLAQPHHGSAAPLRRMKRAGLASRFSIGTSSITVDRCSANVAQNQPQGRRSLGSRFIRAPGATPRRSPRGSSGSAARVSAPSSSRWARAPLAGSACLDRAGAEDQRRHIERQDQQRQQDTLPPRAEGQRRGDAAEQAQRRGADQQAQTTGSGSPPGRDRRTSARTGLISASGSPVDTQCAAHFASAASSSGSGDKRDQVEPAILVIGLEQPVEGQQRRQQRRDPDDPGADARQNFRLRADPEREQHDGQHEKAEDEAGIAALAQGQPKIAPEQAEKRRHLLGVVGIKPQGRGAKPSSARVAAVVDARSAVCVATMTRPPAARCSAIACSSRAWLSASSARRRLVEQPRSAPAPPASRARASRRRCPAESQRHGQSGDRVEPKAASAASMQALPPIGRRRRAAPPKTPSVSRGVNAGFDAHRDGRHSAAGRDAPAISASIGAAPHSSRPAAGAIRAATQPQQARLAAAVGAGQHQSAARPAGETKARRRRAARRAGRRGLSRQLGSRAIGRAPGQRSAGVGHADASSAKKRLRRGKSGAARPSVDRLGRVRGLGDKPVRMNLTPTIWGADWDCRLKKL